MYTLFGQEAKDGDFVLIQDVKFTGGADKIYVAQVRGNKAYAAATIVSGGNKRWLRKETAITIFPASEVSGVEKKIIKKNMLSEKATIPSPTDYSNEIFDLIAEAATERTEDRVRRYGEEYRYR